MSIEIRPKVTMLKILRHLDYKVWYALAEYLDNSIQSFQSNIEALKKIEGDDFKLIIKIQFNHTDHIIRITDNAAGIDYSDFPRAFRPADIPPDNTGLSEFGMGMKSASFWFSPDWTVRTTTIGDGVEREVHFDLKKIEEENIEVVTPTEKKIDKNLHYTVIELRQCDKMPHTLTLSKIKEHLKSIYREFLRKELVEIYIDSDTDPLKFEEVEILNSPIWKDKKPINDINLKWKKEFDFPLDNNKNVRGFVAIRKTGSTKSNGLALFRRGRVIEGSFEDAFKPEDIYGQSNSFQSQRLFGEMHFEGFDVSFTKSGITWGDDMSTFLELLKEELVNPEMNFIEQCGNYRALDVKKQKKRSENVINQIKQENFGEKIQAIFDKNDKDTLVAKENSLDFNLSSSDTSKSYCFNVDYNDQEWSIHIELSYDEKINTLYEIGEHLLPSNIDSNTRNVGIRLSSVHPFIARHTNDNQDIVTVLKIIASFGLAEFIVRENSGVYSGGSVEEIATVLRTTMNDIIIDL